MLRIPLHALALAMTLPAIAPQLAAASQGNLLVPGGEVTYLPEPTDQPPTVIAWPTTSWTRGAPGSVHAAWDSFGYVPDAIFPPTDIEPDGGYGGFDDPALAVLNETTGYGAYSGLEEDKNIYSPAVAIELQVTLPSPTGASGSNTIFVAQVNTFGTEIAPASVSLSYDGGAQQLAPVGTLETQRLPSISPFGETDLVTTVYWWEGFSGDPANFLLQFAASGPHMSLTNLVLDAYSAGDSPVPGDYDRDGYVDASDFDRWKEQFGDSDPLPDGNHSGLVDLGDYVVWRDNLGTGTPPAPLLAVRSVPEPSSRQLLATLATTSVFVAWVHWFIRPLRLRRRQR